jgi:nicotinate-nucleotide pyrophosphorylase (carboxylating)
MGKDFHRKNVGTMIGEFVQTALAEDIGRGDLFARIEPAKPASAKLIAKSEGILAGREYIDVLTQMQECVSTWHKDDGETFKNGDVLAVLEASSHTLLAIERTLLNMLLHASSIATLTNRYAMLIRPYGVKLLDTRKTRPQLRNFEKYAARVGGAVNHRVGLDDCLMLKDTHLKTIEDIGVYIAAARKKIPFTCKIEVEAEDITTAQKAMDAGADIVMCDNMSVEGVKEVVTLRNAKYPHILLEASGNISLETIESYAACGVDAISTGSIVHQANWLDISMKMD